MKTIRVKQEQEEEDLSPVPAWLTDTEEMAPCPCGHPMLGPVAVIRGDTGMCIGYHMPGCLHLRFIHTDSDDEEIDWDDDDE